jgi:glutamine synthetase
MYSAEKAFAGKEDEETWFGLEQEFTLFNLDERTPLGWPEGGMPSRPQGPYYCSVGPENNFGRAITDCMYKACLYAGIAISGVNGEVMPGQQEYQGACVKFHDGHERWIVVGLILGLSVANLHLTCTVATSWPLRWN